MRGAPQGLFSADFYKHVTRKLRISDTSSDRTRRGAKPDAREVPLTAIANRIRPPRGRSAGQEAPLAGRARGRRHGLGRR